VLLEREVDRLWAVGGQEFLGWCPIVS
jgi:hypothetical protein